MAQQFTQPVVIGTWRNGRPIYLMQGGSETTETTTTETTTTASTDDAGQFPANTPVAEMTAPQQAAYWKTQSRKHEGRATAASGLLGKLGVADEAAAQALLDKRDRADALANDLATDTERAAREAREATEKELRPQLAAQAVEDSFRLVIGERKTAEEITEFLGDLNLSRFVGENGRVDTAKVLARAGQFAPATGNQQQQTGRKGPTATVHGSGSGTSSTSAASGRDLWEQQHGRRPGATTVTSS